MSKYIANGITYIESHETYAIVGIATASGFLLILAIDEQGEADVIAKYYLTPTQIVYMKFMPNSAILIAIDKENGLFIVKRESNNHNDIKQFVSLKQNYLDYSIVKTNGTIHALMLCTKIGANTSETPGSHCDYITMEEDLKCAHQVQTIQLSGLYTAMQFKYYDTNKFVLGARITHIDLFECVRSESGKIELNVQQIITTSHCFGSIKFRVNASSVLTYGSDGQILLWDKNSMRMVKSVLAHDKCSRGVKDAVFCPLQR